MFDQAKELRETAGEKSQRMQQLVDDAKAAKRSLTADEQAEFDQLFTDCKTLRRQAENLEGDPRKNAAAVARRVCEPGIRFRNIRTGEEIRSIANYEPMPGADKSLSVGRIVYSMLSNNRSILTDHEQRAAFGGTDSGGGYLLAPELSATVTDLARAASVSIRAGATVVPMTTSELLLTRVSGDPTAYWRAETQAVTSTDITFDRISLKPKTLAAIIPVSIELLEDAANAAEVIEQTLRNALGAELDNKILQGTGAANEPLGIVNTTAITSTSDIGLPSNYNHVSSAVSSILSNNYSGELSALAWISHPRDLEILDQLQDTTNQPMRPTPWVEQLRRFPTTNIDITTTSSLTETQSVVGDFTQVVVGVRSDNVVIRVLDAGTVTDSNSVTWNANTQLLRHVVAYLRADVGILQPSWFTAINGIQTAST